MTSCVMAGTEGYAEESASLIDRYERISFSDLHRDLAHLFPTQPGWVLDIGSGTGRDAAVFAARGHRVTAVEPTDPLRKAAVRLHPSPAIEWIDDGLPDLRRLDGRDGTYDLVMLTAVWMHLDEEQRQRAMRRVSALVRPGGIVIMSLRHGPVPAGRRMFEVSAEDTVRLGGRHDLKAIAITSDGGDHHGRAGVSWSRLALRKDGGV